MHFSWILRWKEDFCFISGMRCRCFRVATKKVVLRGLKICGSWVGMLTMKFCENRSFYFQSFLTVTAVAQSEWPPLLIPSVRYLGISGFVSISTPSFVWSWAVHDSPWIRNEMAAAAAAHYAFPGRHTHHLVRVGKIRQKVKKGRIFPHFEVTFGIWGRSWTLSRDGDVRIANLEVVRAHDLNIICIIASKFVLRICTFQIHALHIKALTFKNYSFLALCFGNMFYVSFVCLLRERDWTSCHRFINATLQTILQTSYYKRAVESLTLIF